MAENVYKAYWGGWEQGDSFSLFVPVNVDYTTPYNWTNYSPVALAGVSYYSNIYTVFIQTNLAEYLTTGFSVPSVSIIDCQVNANKKIYVGPTTYIQIVFSAPYGPALRFYKNNVFVAQASAGGRDKGLTLPSADGDGRFFDLEPTSALTMYTYRYSDVSSLVSFWADIDPFNPPTDPFSPGGESEHGGGGGDFKDPSEDVTDPAVPDVSAVDTGFITIFNPSVSQLNSLASYLWSAGFDLDTFKKMFANPMDCILGLSMLPKIVPAGGSRNVTVGNISTGVSMTLAASQFVKFDCGSVTVKRYSNSFLDYAPYTKVSIYLPFVGIHELSVDEVMNKSVHVKYNIDILSGACAAFVICGGTTLYTYTGQCAASIPVTSGDWSTMINGVIGAVGGAVKAAIGGAAGGVIGAISSGVASLASSAMDVAGMKPSIEHSGNMGGMGGMIGVKTPFLIITRPEQAIPGQQNKYTGYPAFITRELGDLSGYTEIEEIHLENIPATENEITEIYNLLKSGVIL